MHVISNFNLQFIELCFIALCTAVSMQHKVLGGTQIIYIYKYAYLHWVCYPITATVTIIITTFTLLSSSFLFVYFCSPITFRIVSCTDFILPLHLILNKVIAFLYAVAVQTGFYTLIPHVVIRHLDMARSGLCCHSR